MSDLTKVRTQVIDPTTGLAVEVDARTSASATYLENGSSLQGFINSSEEILNGLQKFLINHLDIKHIDSEKVKDVITKISYDDTTGTFTVTSHDGTVEKIDTLLEKTAVSFDLVDGTDENAGKKLLKITLDDGTIKEVDMTSFVDVYTGSDGTQIIVTVNPDGTISGSIVNNSIGESKLTDELVTEIKDQFELEPATKTDLGGVIIGDGLNAENDGTLSTKGVTVNSEVKGLNIETEEITEVISVVGPSTSYEYSIVGAALENPLEVTASTTGVGTLEYQWYKKTIGADSEFVAIENATSNSYTVPVDVEGTTIYFCTVTSTGDGVLATPVNSPQITVYVEESPIITKVEEAKAAISTTNGYINDANTQLAIVNDNSSTSDEAEAAKIAAQEALENAETSLSEAKSLMDEAIKMSNSVVLPSNPRTLTNDSIEEGITAVNDSEANITTTRNAISVADESVLIKSVTEKAEKARIATNNSETYANTATDKANEANSATTSSEANVAATEAETAATNARTEANIVSDTKNEIEDVLNSVTTTNE